MDKIINVLLLIIIFVFDPLAISLVVAANFAFDKANRKNLYDEYEEELYVEPKEKKSGFPEDYNEDDEKRMDIIGQNGNEGEHYDEARGTVPPKEKQIITKTGYQLENNIENVVFEGPSEWQVKLKTGETIWAPREEVQKYITKDPDNIINYL